MISTYDVTETRPQPKGILTLPPTPARQAICGGIHQPDHTTIEYHKIKDSSPDLPFFESRDENSEQATICSGCHFYLSGHEIYGLTFAGLHDFKLHGPWEYDSFYCGHSGWD